jgi:hypothetical protein
VRKVEPHGGLLWERALEFDSQLAPYVSALSIDATGRIFLAGMLHRANFITEDDDSGFLRVLDDAGKLVAAKDYTQDDVLHASGVAFTPEGDALLVASHLTSNKRHAVVLRLDANLETTWSYEHPLELWTEPPWPKLAVAKNGDLLLGTLGPGTPLMAWFGRLDAEGAEVWSDTWGIPERWMVATGVAEKPDGDILVTSQAEDLRATVRRYSLAGELLEENPIFDDTRRLHALAVAQDGRAYIGGMLNTYLEGVSQAWIRELLPDGASGWEFFEPKGENRYYRTVEQLAVNPQGDVWAFGALNFPANAGVWLARFAGASGGVPVLGIDDPDRLVENSYPDHDGSAVFTDREIPTCDPGDYRLAGDLDGSPLSIKLVLATDFGPTYFDVLEVADSAVRSDLDLRWATRILEGSSQALTGGVILLPQDHPLGPWLCITAGDIGVFPVIYEPDAGRVIHFRVTGGRLDADCTGEEVETDLKGCLYRTTPYIP